ncbi:MAG TPA: ATP-binding protein [Polyangiaceae bacterium]
MGVSAEKSLEELTMRDRFALEDLVDREALGELSEGFYKLFRVPLRIFSESGLLLADAGETHRLYTYLATLKKSSSAVQEVVAMVKTIDPKLQGDVTYPCVTGAVYRIVGVTYDRRQLGRIILGPFLPHSVHDLPASLLDLDPEIELPKARDLLAEMPRAREETVAEIAQHLVRTLDLILFSGHRALLASSMHLASVQESFKELQEKNEKLQHAVDRLKELDRLKSNFLATVSHELRTPLTSIIGYSEMLVEGMAGDLNLEQRDFVRTIYEKGEQLLRLIKGLLDLSKLESGTMSLSKSYIDAAPLVRDVAQTVTPVARKKGVQIVVQTEPGLPELWADAARLRQVFLNLADNAVKFTPTGGSVTLSAQISSLESGAEDGSGLVLLARRAAIEFRVSDTGIGIPESERERVFDAFYQVDSSSTREQGGTGLGLSIVRRLVDAHGGAVHVEDNRRSGSGSVFVVRLPCRRATVF